MAKAKTVAEKKTENESKTKKDTTKSVSKSKDTPKKTTVVALNPSSDKNLVIVESPAKAKTLKKFLWNKYEIKASFWHVVELSKKKLWVDIENWFKPTYEISSDKKKVINEFKSILPQFWNVLLATDEDREWEAIARHIANILWLDVATTPRITFHEITKTAIEKAVENPRTIDLNLVNAQQWRRVLDRLVWFKISPILWQKIKRWLSAGRVQSVAVKLVIEKENEIKNFIPQESWKLKAYVVYKNKKFAINLEKLDWKAINIKNIDDVKKILWRIGVTIEQFEKSQDKKTKYLIYKLERVFDFRLASVDKKESKRYPSPPFITSTLQQEASRRFGWGVKQVMSIAQKLYENWYITYMRTDSVNLSALAIWTSKEYIIKHFGEEYSNPRNYTSKSANAQEAHEAIRPTYIDKKPESTWLTGQELKLYSLIWSRTLASQMSEALLDVTILTFNPLDDEKQDWTVKWEVIKFDWFLKLFENTKEEEEEHTEEDTTTLPNIEVWEIVKSSMMEGVQNFSKPPARYTEASLVKKMESLEIGRPSTYAPTISTIQDRGYVKKEWKFLMPTDIAFVVNDYLEKYFQNIMDYKFTANMEQFLDDIATGTLDWHNMLKDFYEGFLVNLEKAADTQNAKVYTWDTCPECGWWLIYKFSKTWKFIGCENYPDCKYTKATQEQSDYLTNLKDKYEWQPCPEWWTIVVKVGRFWPFLTSSEYPKVKRISSIPDEKLMELEKKFGWKPCPKCWKWVMHVKKSKKWYFLACNKYPDCKTAENIKIPKEEEKE